MSSGSGILLHQSSRLPIFCVRPRDNVRGRREAIRSSKNMAKRDLLEHFFTVPLYHDKYSAPHAYEPADDEKHIYSLNGQTVLPDAACAWLSDSEFYDRYLRDFENRLEETGNDNDFDSEPNSGFSHLSILKALETDLIVDTKNILEAKKSLEDTLIEPILAVLRSCYRDKTFTIYNEQIIHEPLTEEIYQGNILANFVSYVNNQPIAIMDIVRYDLPIWIGMKLHFGIMDKELELEIHKWKQPEKRITLLKDAFYDAFCYGFRNCVSLGVERLTLFDGFYFMFFEFCDHEYPRKEDDHSLIVKPKSYKMVAHDASVYTARACLSGFNWYSNPLEQKQKFAFKMQTMEKSLSDHFKNLNILNIGASSETLETIPIPKKADIEFHMSHAKVSLDLTPHITNQLDSDLFRLNSKYLQKYYKIEHATILLRTFTDEESYLLVLQSYVRCHSLQGTIVPVLYGYGTNFYSHMNKNSPYFILFQDLLSLTSYPSQYDTEHFLMASVSLNKVLQCGVKHVAFYLNELRILNDRVVFTVFPGQTRQIANLPALLNIWSGISLPPTDMEKKQSKWKRVKSLRFKLRRIF
jgi:hypothetical protein